jgi:hypothetical protein
MRYVNRQLTLTKQEQEDLAYALVTLKNDMDELAATQAEFPDKAWLRNSTNAFKTVANIAAQLGVYLE